MPRKYGKKASAKVGRALHEMKHGALRSGRGGKVTSRAQAIAIGLAEARERGYKVPSRHHATKKPSQLDREIAESLRAPPSSKNANKLRGHELFYISADQQGGTSAEMIERFSSLAEALDTLARLPAGSITAGNALAGPQLMIVWAAPKHTDLLYWTDGDMSARVLDALTTKALRDQQAPRGVRGKEHGSEQYFNHRFEKARARYWKDEVIPVRLTKAQK